MSRSSCIHRALPPSGPPDGVRRCSLEGSASGLPPPAISPPESLRSWWCCRSCLLLAAVRGAQPRGGWRSSAIARLQGFSSYSSAATSPRWSSTRMTTSLVVERSELGCGLPPPPPRPQLQGCSSSSLGWRASRVGVLPSAWASDPLLPPAFGGQGRSPALRRGRTSATWGRPATGAVSCRVPGSLAWMALVPPPALLTAAWSGRGYPSTARAMVAPCAGLPHPRLLLRRRPHRGVVQDVVRRGGGGRVFGWSCPHSRRRTGARTSSRMLRQSSPPVQRWPLLSVLRWSPPLVTLPVAEVVASAGETISATYRRASNSLALMASLSPPVGRRGRGPFHNGARAEVIATAGESSVQRWSPPSVLRWSPPLASRLELAIT
jgi:hypothetical protein